MTEICKHINYYFFYCYRLNYPHGHKSKARRGPLRYILVKCKDCNKKIKKVKMTGRNYGKPI